MVPEATTNQPILRRRREKAFICSPDAPNSLDDRRESRIAFEIVHDRIAQQERELWIADLYRRLQSAECLVISAESRIHDGECMRHIAVTSSPIPQFLRD